MRSYELEGLCYPENATTPYHNATINEEDSSKRLDVLAKLVSGKPFHNSYHEILFINLCASRCY